MTTVLQKNEKTLLLLKPRGFCAGVVRAIDIVRIALEAFGPPIYVRKEIVHNRFVVEELQDKGAIFVDSVDEVPSGERVIYSAHGVSPEVREASAARAAGNRCDLSSGDQGPRGSRQIRQRRLLVDSDRTSRP